MRRYVLTGTPGSGKTALLRRLEIDGYAVVEEAATDVIALRQAYGIDEPWRDPVFLDRIVDLQRRRQLAVDRDVALFDRSPVCTLALSRHLGISASTGLRAERIHETTYLELGFTLVEVPAAPLEVRAEVIRKTVGPR
jgi:predicted ATPase